MMITEKKITLISKVSDSFETITLQESAEKHGWSFEQYSPLAATDFLKKKSIGEIIITRTTHMGANGSCAALEYCASHGALIINHEMKIDRPLARNKMYQHDIAALFSDIPVIPTMKISKNENEKDVLSNFVLDHPSASYILKSDSGSKGTSVMSVNKEILLASVDRYKGKVVQPYIDNDHDYRVFMIGETVIEIMRRTKREGEFRNNVSQGGKAERENDEQKREHITAMAIKLQKLFRYDVVGIDIMEERGTGILYFLEVNSSPQWEGLQTVTEIDVADAIISYSIEKRYAAS